jgi:hypothetical protein
MADLDQFISILPSDQEILQFRERLEEFGFVNFGELSQIKAPRVLKKLDKGEWFVIKVLINDKVMDNARIIQSIFEVDKMIESSMQQYNSWKELENSLIRGHSTKILKSILGVALQMST